MCQEMEVDEWICCVNIGELKLLFLGLEAGLFVVQKTEKEPRFIKKGAKLNPL